MNDDTPLPYGHYAIPVTGVAFPDIGLSAAATSSSRESKRRNANLAVPDVLSINLPKGPESPRPPPRRHSSQGGDAWGEGKPETRGKRDKKKRGGKAAGGSVVEAGIDAQPPLRSKDRARSATDAGGSGGVEGGEFESDSGGFESVGGSEGAKQPPLSGPTAVNGSADCRSFLSRIPDLSFMVKSTLSLPEGAKR